MPVRNIGQAGPNKRRARKAESPEVAKARAAAVAAAGAVVQMRADFANEKVDAVHLQAAEDALTAANQALRDAVAAS